MMGRSTESTLLLASFGLRPTSRFAGLRVGAKISPHGQGELSCFMFRLMTINNFSVRSTFLFFLCRCETWPTLMRLDIKNVITEVYASRPFRKPSRFIPVSLLDLSSRGLKAGGHLSRFFSRRSTSICLSEDCSRPFAN